ncbi:hypothetical protein ApAK_01935, partial [Thermoplasmatales archaeon AK]|nr:hypothetical protein [Thermoplasmatales archaeon AK]
MPIMVTLSDAVRKKESKISLELTNNIINVLQGVFGFEGKALEVWERETSTSLGGKLVASAEWNKGDYEGKFSEYTDQLLSAHILVVKGVINIPTKLKLWAQFNTWSNLRKAYSDVFIDTDPCEKDTIVDVFWTKDGQHLPIDFVSRMAGIRIFVDGKNRKAVAECNISPYVTHTNEFDVDGIVGIYSSKAKPYFLLKSIMNKLVKDSERGKNYQEKLDLINIERLSRKIYELG